MQLLRLKYYQFRRDLGIWFILITAGVFLFTLQVANPAKAFILPGIAGLLLINYHTQRKDINFIRKYLGKPWLQIAVNYNLLVLPVSLALLINGHWVQALVTHVMAIISASFAVQFRKLKLYKLMSRIPESEFEWKSGLRNYFIVIFLMLCLAVFLSPVKLIGIVPLLLLNTILASFHSEYEPLVMLNPHNFSPADFLNRKTNFTIKMIAALNLPLLAVNSIANPELWWFGLSFLIGFVILGICSIYIKYANYEPGQGMTFHMDFLLLYAAVFIPYLIPLGIYLVYANKKKAITNLQQFLT